MEVTRGPKAVCAADMFTYDEQKAMNLRKFFKTYKDQLPMLIIIIGGNYGETKFDCFDNLQVLRVNNYTQQMRVVVDDTRNCIPSERGVLTVPVDTLIKFQVVKGHSKLGRPQKLSEIVAQNDIPFQIQMTCDPYHPVRVGNTRYVAKDFEMMLVKEKYYEHYFVLNCIDSPDLKMNKEPCMACLSEQVDATPITGLKYGTQAEFDDLCRKLTESIRTESNKELYDTSLGNPDFDEYSSEELLNLLEVCEFKSGLLTDEQDPGENDEDYIYPEFKPAPPPRNVQNLKSPEPKPFTDHKKGDKPEADRKKKVSSDSSDVKSQKPHKIGLPAVKAFIMNKIKHESDTQKHDEHPTSQTVSEEDIENDLDLYDTSETPPPVRRPPGGHLAGRDDNEVPELPPRPQDRPKPASPVAQHDRGSEFLVNKNYQNTTMNRATVKPIVQTREVVGKGLKEDREDIKIVYARKGMVQHDEGLSVYSEPYEKLEVKEPSIKEDSYLPSVGYTQVQKDNKMSQKANEPVGSVSSTPAPSRPPRPKQSPEGYELVQPVSPPNPLPSTYTIGRVPGDMSTVSETDSESSHQFDIRSLSISDLSQKLKELRLEKYAESFEENQVDGTILSGLSVDDFVSELGMKKLEAVRLQKFVESGHIPK